MASTELVAEIRTYLSLLKEQVRSEYLEQEAQIMSHLEKLSDRINDLELRLNELEKDRVHKIIVFEAERLGISEDELLRKIAVYLRENHLLP